MIPKLEKAFHFQNSNSLRFADISSLVKDYHSPNIRYLRLSTLKKDR